MACLFCHSQTKSYFHYGTFLNLPYGLVRCSSCGLAQTEPMPDQNFLTRWYQKYDVLGEHDPYYADVHAADPWSTLEGREILNRFELIRRHPASYESPVTSCRLLDIGSGHGLFLALVKRVGWQGQGIEINERAAENSRERFNVSVHGGTIETFPSVPQSFDVVTLWDIFEHVPDPRRLIRRGAELLRPGGILFIETPNIDALLDRVIMICARLSVSGPARTFYGLHHLTLWNQNSIRRLLEEEGFTVREIRSARTPAGRVFRETAVRDRFMRFGVDVIQWFGKMLGRENKMIVVAQKRSQSTNTSE